MFRYSAVEPIYNIWCEYFTNLVGDVGRQLDDRMLKADYHGALLMVTEASNPTMVWLSL